MKIQIPAVNIDLAEAAQRISRERNINFGDALFIARREMADTVTPNSGSPLRDQKQSSRTAASEVRDAVIGGLNAVAPSWMAGPNTDAMAWWATTGEQDIRAGARAVTARLEGLGLGPQITSSLTTEMTAFLSTTIKNAGIKALRVSDVIQQAADHTSQVYADALANKVATQVWSEAERISNGSHSAVSLDSIVLRDRAIQVSKQRNISFGEALTLVRHDMADDVADPQQVGEAVTGALNGFFSQELNGAQEKININMLAAKELVSKALAPFNIGSLALDKLTADLEEYLGSLPNAISASDVKAIAAKAGSRSQKFYAQYLAASRG